MSLGAVWRTEVLDGPGAGRRRHDDLRTQTFAESAGRHLIAPVAVGGRLLPCPEYSIVNGATVAEP